MVAAVIKSAFIEGRSTDTPWEDSKAKADANRLELFTSNVGNFNGRELRKRIHLARLHPTTLEELDYFPSRLEAAKWIVKNVLNRGEDGKKALSITGNMHMCIMCNYRSYGSFWKYLTEAEYRERVGE
jgi:hypothetical protein